MALVCASSGAAHNGEASQMQERVLWRAEAPCDQLLK
eukprot:CAMPEP_0195581484 /NCGR_PEP_ID=MMETSP0814-20130614/20348_1 /TAXON_ID=97485 /ORGANISM="Prymnesium parvum, Strain Texoma1" /LENGTH=36 /DNA_ID= /DNA_START= /DNA_END= /DNA_ORIENTATION=